MASDQALVRSTQRPIPLQRRDDLRIERIEFQGVGSWVVKDPVGLKYHRLQAEQHGVLQLLDGQRNLEEIRRELLHVFPTLSIQLTDVQHLIADLHQKGLVSSNRPGQGTELIKQCRKRRRDKLFATAKNMLFLRLPGWDPESTLEWLSPKVRWMFQPWSVCLAIALVCSSLVLLTVQFDQFHRRLPEFKQFFGWPNLIYLWATLGIAKIIHEFGHGLSCKHFGSECHEMGLMLLVFSPCLYCDVSDSWMLGNKWKRILIAGAGMYLEVIISAIAIFVWWNTKPGLLHHLCLNVFFVTAVTTVIFNANPLMRFDGYYMLSDFLEIPNLRPKADKYLREQFAWYCLGIESRPDPFMPETGRTWFLLFAVTATIYRWFILFSILLFLYTVLKPYGLQSIGITLAAISAGGIVINLVVNVYRIIAAPRAEPMSFPKVATTLTLLCFLLVGGLTIPLPLHVESVFLIEPHQVQHVFTSTPGRLTRFEAEPGQPVSQGQLLAVLSNPEQEDAIRALEVRKRVQKANVDLQHELDDLARERLAAEKLRSIEKQLADLKEQTRHLEIRAPCEGVVVAPPRLAEPKLDVAHHELSTWFGTPLETRNLGCYFDERTHLLSIAPSDRLNAILIIDQGDRNDILVGQTVEIKFDSLPDQTYRGKVKEISERDLEFVPKTLSNKLGGELPTVTDDQGRERLTSNAYQATVQLERDTRLLRPGMRGRARFVVDRRPAGDWIWRYLRRTFHFRL